MIQWKYKFYVQLVMEGLPPIKVNQDGEIKRNIGLGNVGIDIGTRTIASKNMMLNYQNYVQKLENIQKEKNKLQRKLDRQRRSNNPNNYNEDGTIKRGIKLEWD